VGKFTTLREFALAFLIDPLWRILRRAMSRTACFALIALLAPTTSSPSTQSPGTPQAGFRGGIELIQVDVSVLAEDGHPVRGLTQSDFTVLEDGRPRPVASFAAVDIAPPSRPPAVWMTEASPDVTTNDRVGKRVVVIAIDDGSLSTNGALWGVVKARSIARTIVEALGPDDLAAVVFTEHANTAQNFTSDRRLLLAAIDTAALFPAPSRADPADPLDNRRPSCSCGVCSIATLERVAEGLVPLRQQRKTIFYISPGVHVGASISPFEALPSPFSTFQDSCEAQKHDALMDTFGRAQLANVTISPVDPNGLGAAGGQSYPDFLRAIAENTGGRAVVSDNDPELQVGRLLAESSAYYLLGFEPAPHKADGGFHRIQVNVAGRDVQVRARSGYFAENAKKRKTPRTETASLDDAIGGLVANSEVPLQVSVAPFADGRDKGALAIALSVTEPARPAEHNAAATAGSKSATDVDVLATVLDSQGRSSGSRRLTLRLGLNRPSGRDLHYEILPRLPVSPGRYEVRLAVRTGDARTGSVYAFVNVPDFTRAPVSLSGLVVTASPSGSAAPADAYADLLPVVPTARRVFRPTDRVTVFARGYQGGRHALVSATATARIVDAANQEVLSSETPLDEQSFGARRSADYRLAVPVDRLGPGYYLLTVRISTAAGAVERSLSFQIQ
jgi:VWFA-related protein